MGVPALFRWLTKKYPKIVSPVLEEQPQEIEGVSYPIDISRPNPNGEEIDNLYLDFNGIVHPCSHPEDKPAPATESEMMMDIFTYTDRVVNMVRPRKLLYIAVDGVAPRAKMNQQRARRFRAAMDAKESDAKKEEFQTLLRKQQEHTGESTTISDVIKKTWDSNVITPGTPFMFILAQSIRYWCQWKLNTDPGWATIKVIISDASVPGEGEHKIMNFIRSQRSDPEYNPNTQHVMYGLDADLIMLGIATHEPHFRVLREDVEVRDARSRLCKMCGQKGHYAENCRGQAKQKSGEFDEKGSKPEPIPFVWLNVPTLREYLGAEMFVPDQPFRFDLERALDDWVFMCFFVGNDFLPHLPSLDIHEDGIDKLIAIWRDNIPVMGGYLTCDGSVDLARAQCILQGLAKQEDAIFRRRREVDEKKARNQKRRKDQEEREQNRNGRDAKRRRSSPDYGKGRNDTRAPAVPIDAIPVSSLGIEVDYNMIVNRGAVDRTKVTNQSAAAALKAQMLAKAKEADTPIKSSENGPSTNTPVAAEPPLALGKRKAELMDEPDLSTPGRSTPISPSTPKMNGGDPDDPPPDTVRLWEEGYADRYYEQKFHVAPDDIEFRHKVAAAYVEGLSWVLLYYFQGCASWTWYYPYHYAPFAADFSGLENMTVKFEKGTPFRPYEQLMGVLPAASNHAIPKPFHSLMTDPDSDIIDFYPEDFALDLNGKKQSWKAVILLPFIDETRLLEAMGTKYHLLSDEERARNERGSDALLLSDRHPLYDKLATEFYSKKSKKDGTDKAFTLDIRIGSLSGMASKNENFLPHMDLAGPEEDIKLEPEVIDDRSMSAYYTMPPATHIHKSMLLRGVVLPPPALNSADLALLKSKTRTSGRDFGGAPLYDNTRRDPMDHHHNGYGGRGRGRGDGRINYAADRPPLPPPPGMPGGWRENQDGTGNPFAAFLDPKFAPGMPMPGHGREPPPPPPQHYGGGQNGGHQNQGRNSSGQYGNGYGDARDSYGGQANQGYNSQQHQGYRNGSDQQQYGGGYQQGGGGGRGGRSASDGYNNYGQSHNQGYGNQQGGRDGYRGNYQGRYNENGGGYNRR